MQVGKVKWFNKDKGFGFIASSGKDYFVHFRDIKTYGVTALSDGQDVEFVAEKTPKGNSAKEVTLV